VVDVALDRGPERRVDGSQVRSANRIYHGRRGTSHSARIPVVANCMGFATPMDLGVARHTPDALTCANAPPPGFEPGARFRPNRCAVASWAWRGTRLGVVISASAAAAGCGLLLVAGCEECEHVVGRCIDHTIVVLPWIHVPDHCCALGAVLCGGLLGKQRGNLRVGGAYPDEHRYVCRDCAG